MINLIIVSITDLTDAPSSLKKALTFILTKGKITTDDYRFHLIDCSLCQTFWCSLLYIILTGHFTIPYIALCILSAIFTNESKSIILLCKDIINLIVIEINKLIKLIASK